MTDGGPVDLHPLVDAAVVEPSMAAAVVTPAHDAMSVASRRRWRADHPDSWLHVLAEDDSETRDEMDGCRAALERLRPRAYAQRQPFLAVLQLERDGRTQTGLVADLDLRDVASGLVHAHERTRRDREDQLLAHLESVGATASPVSLTHLPVPALRDALADITRLDPYLTLTDTAEVDRATETPVHRVVQRLWLVEDPARIDRLLLAARQVPELVVLDGHHRTAAASRFASATGAFARLLSVIFPTDELTVRPFDRVVDVDADEFLLRCQSEGAIGEPGPPRRPETAGQVVVATAQHWHSLVLPAATGDNIRSRLDVVRLGRLLARAADVLDPRGDPRLGHLPGLGTAALAAAVADGGVGIAMWPPSIADIMAVATSGGTMPPKSTYVVPKVRSGLLLVTRVRR